MKKTYLFIFAFLFVVFASAIHASAHCEIPCGIYDDDMRIHMISEHIATIERSMDMIKKLDGKKYNNSNQLIRWVMNKEHHADEIQHIVAQYFLTQRIKPNDKNYEKKLKVLHRILILSMKSKQSIDTGNVKKLHKAVKEFSRLYFK